MTANGNSRWKDELVAGSTALAQPDITFDRESNSGEWEHQQHQEGGREYPDVRTLDFWLFLLIDTA